MAAFTALAILTAVSTTMQVVGQVKAGNAAKRAGAAQQDAANSQAELSDYNASVADVQATDATQRGAIDESRYRIGIRQAIATQRVGFAGGNVDVGFGSAVDVQGDAAFLGELDALQIRQNAAMEAYGFKVQAFDYRKQAEIARKTGVFAAQAGKEQQTASRYQAAGTIIGGSTSLLQARYGYGKGA